MSRLFTWVAAVLGASGRKKQSWLLQYFPQDWAHAEFADIELWQWAGVALALFLAVAVGLLVQRIVLAVVRRVARLTRSGWDDGAVEAARGPVFMLVWSMWFAAMSRTYYLQEEPQDLFDTICRSTVIVAVAWFLLRLLHFSARYVETNLSGELARDVRSRGLQTQLVVLRRLLKIAVYILAAALLLMQFSVVRTVGVSLLASAGIAGLVVGLAAQKSIGNLLAGIQLSITQPIRLGDSIVVEGEVGTVQEITLTYVVVRIWDLRRMVVPITYFLEKPFQNWSRDLSEMLGTFNLYVDYSADVSAIRAEMERLLKDDPAIAAKWNGGTKGLVVTDVSPNALTLRVLVSAADSGANFDLRCLLREAMMRYLNDHPEWMVRAREQRVGAEEAVQN